MEKSEWLLSLKEGDKVARHGSYGNVTIRVVERLTTTQIILDNGDKFRRDSGLRIGGNKYYYVFIDQVTDAVKLKIKTGNLQYKISVVDFKSLSNDKIERILSIVREPENKESWEK